MIKHFVLLMLFASGLQINHKRLLLLYADADTNAQLIKQKQLLDADAAGLRERDLIVKIYLKDKNPQLFYKKNIKEPFTVILVGKDGGEKLRQHKYIPLNKLYDLIDAMPMRRQEMNH